VPRSIERIVRRCLAKDPAARYASGAELEGALVAAVPRRRRRLLLDVGLLLLAIGITLALSTSPALRDSVARLRGSAAAERPLKQLAVLPFRSVGGGPDGEAFAAGMAEVLNNKLRQLEQFQGTLRVVSGNEVVREGISTAREARRVFGATLALTGTLRWSGERLTVTSELVDTGTQLVLSARDADVERKEAGALATILLRRASEMLELELRPEANALRRSPVSSARSTWSRAVRMQPASLREPTTTPAACRMPRRRSNARSRSGRITGRHTRTWDSSTTAMASSRTPFRPFDTSSS